MRNIYLAVALAALAFSACVIIDKDDDKGSSLKSGVCYVDNIPSTGDLAMCAEGITESLSRSDCEYIAEEWGGGTPNIKNSCPRGEIMKCNIENEGYLYVYGQTLVGYTCEDFGASSEGSNSVTGACYLYDDTCYDFKSIAVTSSKCINEGGTPMNSCPTSGRKLKCNDEGYYDISYYGEDWDGYTCNDLGYTDTTPSNRSSSSNPSSSSSSSSLGSGVCYVNDYYEYCYEGKTGTASPSACVSEGGVIVSNCPSGYKQKCYDSYDGNFYLYDAGETCEDWGMVSLMPSSNSNSGSNIACYIDEYEYCMEDKTGTVTPFMCDYLDGTVMSSCPSYGQELKCEDEDIIYYFYGSVWAGETCSSLDI